MAEPFGTSVTSGPASVPVAAPSPFVGRSDALDHLGAALAMARLGHLSGVLISGPMGIGKTRLVAEFVARRARGLGRQVRGVCVPDPAGSGPLEPFRQILQDLGAAEVLGAADAGAGPGGPVPSPEPRFRAVADALRRAAATTPALTVTAEDLHWADPTSLELLRFLVRALADAPILLLGTYRDDADLTPELRSFVTAIDRAPHVSRLPLVPLDRPELERIVTHRLRGDADPAVIERLLARSEGITLFAEELAGTVARGEEGPVPATLDELFVALLDRLETATRELVDHAAVCGTAFSHDLLTAMAELPDATLEKQVDELLDLGVLVTDGAGTGYRFRHALLHQSVYAQLRPAVRRRLHARCARTLAARPDLATTSAGAHQEVAGHWQRAGEHRAALVATLQAADEATADAAYSDAFRLELEAVGLLGRLPPEERADLSPHGLLARAAASAGRAGEHGQAVDLLERALATTGRPDVQADLNRELIAARFLAGDLAGAARTALRALESLPAAAPPTVRATLLALSGIARATPDVPGTPLEATSEALALARRVDDPETLCNVLCAHGLNQASVGLVAEARASLDEADRLALEVADPRTALRPAVYRSLLLQRLGAAHQVVALGRETIVRADRLGVARSVGRQVRTALVDALLTVGRWDEAAEVIDDGLMWGEGELPGMLLLLAKADLAVRRGRFAAAERDLATVRQRVADGHPRAEVVAADLAWWRRDPTVSRFHAARGFERASRLGASEELGRLGFALARAVHAPDGGATADDRGHVEQAIAVLAATADRPLPGAWYATALAEVAGAGPAALGPWLAAGSAWRQVDDVSMRAYTAWRVGAAQRCAGDDAAAAASLATAEELAGPLGAEPLLAEIRVTSGAGRARRDADRASSDGPVTTTYDASEVGLTDREAQVLRLLAEGWTNKRIAEELVISPRTVGSHVSSVLRKLDVGTRGEAAAIAHRLGSVDERG
jgi:DNA-binding CsgD family transcriptional regulator